METLEREWWERAIASLGAGCDYVLCCSADLKKKAEIAEKVREYLAANFFLKKAKNMLDFFRF
jgi:hypothetical protein